MEQTIGVHRSESRVQSPDFSTYRYDMKRVFCRTVSLIVETRDTWMICSSIQSLLPDSNFMYSSSLKFQVPIPSFLYCKWALIVALYKKVFTTLLTTFSSISKLLADTLNFNVPAYMISSLIPILPFLFDSKTINTLDKNQYN